MAVSWPDPAPAQRVTSLCLLGTSLLCTALHREQLHSVRYFPVMYSSSTEGDFTLLGTSLSYTALHRG